MSHGQYAKALESDAVNRKWAFLFDGDPSRVPENHLRARLWPTGGGIGYRFCAQEFCPGRHGSQPTWSNTAVDRDATGCPEAACSLREM